MSNKNNDKIIKYSLLGASVLILPLYSFYHLYSKDRAVKRSVSFIADVEQFRAKPYRDGMRIKGFAIGYGFFSRTLAGLPFQTCTELQAKKHLEILVTRIYDELRNFEKQKGFTLTVNEKVSAISFFYNLGTGKIYDSSSSIQRVKNSSDFVSYMSKYLGSGNPVERRKKEISNFKKWWL